MSLEMTRCLTRCLNGTLEEFADDHNGRVAILTGVGKTFHRILQGIVPLHC